MSEWSYGRRVQTQGARAIWDFSHSSGRGDHWLGFEYATLTFQGWRDLEADDSLNEVFVALLPDEEKAAALAAAIAWRIECLGG